MTKSTKQLADFLADVVMTGYYLAEPPKKGTTLLHDAEMKCLKIIATLGPLEMHALARYLHATKARASQLVDSLVSHGYAARLPGRDLRVVMVTVTVEGAKAVNDLRKKYDELAIHIEEKIGKQKAKQLAAILEEITPLSKEQY